MTSIQASSVVIAGSTGLVGSRLVECLLSTPVYPLVNAVLRREPTNAVLLQAADGTQSKSAAAAAAAAANGSSAKPTSKYHPVILPDTSTWPEHIATLCTPPKASSNDSPAQVPSVFFTALGTSRGQAGSLDAQRAIDHTLNLSLCRAAQSAGVRVCVIISSSGANHTSRLPYLQMKGALDRDVAELNFPHLVILRPGLLVGDREDRRWGTEIIAALAVMMGKISNNHAMDFWAQDARVVARAAVNAVGMCERGEAPLSKSKAEAAVTVGATADGAKEEKGKVWILEQADIVRLGRTQWTWTK